MIAGDLAFYFRMYFTSPPRDPTMSFPPLSTQNI